LEKYDLIAVCPSDESLLHQACEKLQVDIISLDLSSKLNLRFRTKTIGAAVAAGVMFEICYSASLRGLCNFLASKVVDQNARRNLISNAMSLVKVTKGQNIIISSGAHAAMEMRGPYDVINLYAQLKHFNDWLKGASYLVLIMDKLKIAYRLRAVLL
jgi:ribonuclease P/MRP protein subunit RPP1